MGYSLRRFVLALAGVAASSQEQTPPANINQPFEVDAIFPRPINQTSGPADIPTFKANEIIPLVLAVQNMTAWTVGNRSMLIDWDIMTISANGTRGRILEYGVFDTADAAKTNPAFLVAVTNSSTWYQNTTERSVPPKAPGDRYLFQWTASLYANNDTCYFRYPDIPNLHVWNTASMFDVLTEAEEKLFNGTTASVDIPQAPQCPGLSGVYEATFNETSPDCQARVVEVETRQGNPCAVKVDSAVASSISSRVASSTSAWNAPSTTAPPASTSSGAAGVARPVQTAMAAACLLCGLALS